MCVIKSKHQCDPAGSTASVVNGGSGGFIGTELGSHRLANPVIQKLLSLILVIAVVKMIIAAW